jgi:NAD(P)-dependent dehydrogenase (short-subunit alcohol dehydrogenase family)
MTDTGPTTLTAPRPQAVTLAMQAAAPRDASVAVVGAGDYIGGAICEKFAAEGYRVFGGRRNGDKLAALKSRIEAAGGRFEGRSLDARQESEIAAFLAWADADQPLDAVIFNVGANVNFPILETTERVFRKVWEMACQAGFFTGREAARLLLAHGRGSIFFTGATASVRGGVGYAAFASAKAGLRAVAQSMARELGPRNIHVAHLVIDSGVDTDFVRSRISAARGPEALETLPPDTLMNPASIAAAYWDLHQQSRDGWTFELDLRPFAETW